MYTCQNATLLEITCRGSYDLKTVCTTETFSPFIVAPIRKKSRSRTESKELNCDKIAKVFYMYFASPEGRFWLNISLLFVY